MSRLRGAVPQATVSRAHGRGPQATVNRPRAQAPPATVNRPRVRAPRVTVAAAAGLAAAVLAAGCGSAARPAASATATPGPGAVALPLSSSVTGAHATWATVPMGTVGPNLFWQLFVLPAGATRWTLTTPPDIATNGAITLAAGDGTALVTGILPSHLLGFSPITSTANDGRSWAASAPDPGLASVPDALAAAPDGSELITLDHNGQVDLGRPGTAARPRLTSAAALAATTAGRACALAGLTAAAFTPAGSPLLAGQCARPGVAGIFLDAGGTWQAAGPALPASLAGERLEVIRLTRTGSGLSALLQAGAGRSATLVAAWSSTGSRWTLSPPLRLDGQAVLSSSFGSGSLAVGLTGRHGELLAAPSATWQPLPELPPGRAVTLALPAAGDVDALAATGSVLTAWQLHAPSAARTSSAATAGASSAAATAGAYGPGSWTQIQRTTVPIQYGSSS